MAEKEGKEDYIGNRMRITIFQPLQGMSPLDVSTISPLTLPQRKIKIIISEVTRFSLNFSESYSFAQNNEQKHDQPRVPL